MLNTFVICERRLYLSRVLADIAEGGKSDSLQRNVVLLQTNNQAITDIGVDNLLGQFY